MATLVLDIDDTLGDLSQREHFADEGDWDSFFDPELVSQDKPITKAQRSLPKILTKFDKLIFLTGRPNKLKGTTQDWLSEHFGLEPGDYKIFMREDGDVRSSKIVKKELINEFLSPEEETIFVDDDVENLNMMAQYGETLAVPEAWDVLLEEEPEEQEYE